MKKIVIALAAALMVACTNPQKKEENTSKVDVVVTYRIYYNDNVVKEYNDTLRASVGERPRLASNDGSNYLFFAGEYFAETTAPIELVGWHAIDNK